MTDLTAALRDLADSEFKALITVETAERLAVKAYHAIESGDLDEAKRILAALTDETTSRTATAVKDQHVSDAIAAKAAEAVRTVLDRSPEAVDRDDENTVEHAERARQQEPQYGFAGRPDRPGGV